MTTPRRGVILADFDLFLRGKTEEMQEFQGFRARHAVACFEKENFPMCRVAESYLVRVYNRTYVWYNIICKTTKTMQTQSALIVQNPKHGGHKQCWTICSALC